MRQHSFSGVVFALAAFVTACGGEVVIGLEEGDPAYLLDRVSGAVRLSDGRIVISNSGSVELRVYDAEGRYLQAIGRQGGGPGEFRRPDHIRRGAGETIEVWDAMLRPISVFDSQGRYVRRDDLRRVAPEAR
jgi:hypothetical protein